MSHLKSLGPRRVTWSKFHNKEPQILDVSENLVPTAGDSQDLGTPAKRNTHSIQFFYRLSVTTVPASVRKEPRDVLSSYFAVTIHNKWVIKHACLINHAQAYNPKFRHINMLAFRNWHTGFLISQIRKINSDWCSTYKIKVYTHQNVTSLKIYSNHCAYRCVSVQVNKLTFNSLITGVQKFSKNL